jgi:transcriptional regulator with XRE-family HTH domain
MARMTATPAKADTTTDLSALLAAGLTEALAADGWGAGVRLAAATGLDSSQISAFARGKGNPTFRTVEIIAHALGLHPLQLLGINFQNLPK